MSKFKVGDSVRVLKESAFGSLKVGAVHKVLDVRSHTLMVDVSPVGTSAPPSQYWEHKMFELVRPAEVAQATAILDSQQDGGWWSVPESDLLQPEAAEWVHDLGLEVRVQVRRVQS